MSNKILLGFTKEIHHETMKNNSPTMILVIVVVIILFLVLLNKNCGGSSGEPDSFGFNNSEYQNSTPNVKRQYDYYKCIAKECGGKTHDYSCLSKCHLKTFRRGMQSPDIKDLVCQSYFEHPDQYYKCLEQVYSDYRYP